MVLGSNVLNRHKNNVGVNRSSTSGRDDSRSGGGGRDGRDDSRGGGGRDENPSVKPTL